MKPYLKAQTIPLDGLQDRRRKLTDSQKEHIRKLYAKGNIGTRSLARLFGVSRSLVCIIVNPSRAAAVSAHFKANWKLYASRRGPAYHAASIRNTRNYKYSLFKDSLAESKPANLAKPTTRKESNP